MQMDSRHRACEPLKRLIRKINHHHSDGTFWEKPMKCRTRTIATLVLLGGTQFASAQDNRKHIVLDRSAERDQLPFSDAVLVGNTLYLSGYIGIDSKTGAPPKSAEEETRLAMEDLKRRVEAAGMTMDDLVMVHVLSTDLSLFTSFNNVYRNYFHNGFPARTFTGSSQLLLGAHFEVTAVAVKRDK
jgi:2-iminobutanoate/2-iminopropanoate deaminase